MAMWCLDGPPLVQPTRHKPCDGTRDADGIPVRRSGHETDDDGTSEQCVAPRRDSGRCHRIASPCHGESAHFLCPALAEHPVFVVSVRNGSQLTGAPWDLRLAGHTRAYAHISSFLIMSCSNEEQATFSRVAPNHNPNKLVRTCLPQRFTLIHQITTEFNSSQSVHR